MAEIDTSFYPKPAPTQNPLQALGSFAATQNALMQNKVMQSEFAAREAVGLAAKNSIDPATGEMDLKRFATELYAHPDSARLAPQALTGAQERARTAIQIQKEKFELYKGFNDEAFRAVSALLVNPDATHEEVYLALGRLKALGGTTDQEIAVMAQLVPRWEEKPGETAQTRAERKQEYTRQFRDTLKPWAVQAMGTKDQLDTLLGKIEILQLGDRIQVASVTRDSVTPVGGAVRMGLTPEAATAPREFLLKTPEGTQKVSLPHQAWLALQAVTGPLPVDVPFDVNNLTPAQASAPFEYTDPKTNQPMKTTLGAYLSSLKSGAGAGKSGAIPGAITSGAPLGEIEAQNRIAKISGDQFEVLEKAADQVPIVKASLADMKSALPKFSSGPVSELSLTLKNFATQFGLTSEETKDRAAAQEKFTKLAIQIALQQLQSFGSEGTNDKLSAAIKANPGTALSNLGNENIINYLMGMQDATAVKRGAWQDWLDEGNSPKDYAKFSREFNKSFDPRVYQMRFMSADQRKQMQKAMSAGELKDFVKAHAMAVAKGFIEPPEGIE